MLVRFTVSTAAGTGTQAQAQVHHKDEVLAVLDTVVVVVHWRVIKVEFCMVTC